MGDAQCGKAAESIECILFGKKNCKEKILDTPVLFVYDSKGDSNG